MKKIQFNIANQMYPSACDTCLVSHFVCSEDVIKKRKETVKREFNTNKRRDWTAFTFEVLEHVTLDGFG